jgi:hypothetical protein
VIYQWESRKRRSFAGASASWPLGGLTARGEEVTVPGNPFWSRLSHLGVVLHFEIVILTIGVPGS